MAKDTKIIYQVVYLNDTNGMVGVSQVAFTTKREATEYGNMVCNRKQHIEVIEIAIQ